MVATTLDGTIKSTFHGNRLLLTGTLGADGNFTDVNHHLGLVSVDAFENQAKADNQYADNETWPVASASPVMQGSVTLMQMDDKLRTDFFGQAAVNATVGDASVSGFADTGVYPQRALMYVTDGIAKDADGNVVKSLLITFMPNAQCISTPQKKSETDSDGISVVTWSADIQATSTEKYAPNSVQQPIYEFQVVGNDAVNSVIAQIKSGKMPVPTGAKG